MGLLGRNNEEGEPYQHVPHVHFHLIPRSGSDSLEFFFRMLVHFTGLFGLRTPARTPQSQADLIRKQMQRTEANEALARSA